MSAHRQPDDHGAVAVAAMTKILQPLLVEERSIGVSTLQGRNELHRIAAPDVLQLLLGKAELPHVCDLAEGVCGLCRGASACSKTPVPAVAGKARHLPRRHRADLTEANLGDMRSKPAFDAGAVGGLNVAHHRTFRLRPHLLALTPTPAETADPGDVPLVSGRERLFASSVERTRSRPKEYVQCYVRP
jgi:hypothetical protein